jgi:glycosyltransferase 2 family protein
VTASPPIQAPHEVAAAPRRTHRLIERLWPVVGVGAVVLCGWILFREVRHLSWADVAAALDDIPAHRWLLAFLSTAVAYAALAWYDRIALTHLGFRLSWRFISVVSFTTYALSHNIGMTMFSGAMVRYRAYSTKGLTLPDVGVLVAFCSFTFFLGTILLGGLVCVVDPALPRVVFEVPEGPVRMVGILMLALVALYLSGSALHLRPLRVWKFKLEYPRFGIALRQLCAGPLELLGAAGIIYCALPDAANPGFVVVLGIFLASFSAALVSHAPGGLGVLELVFVNAMPEVPQADVLAALLVFRLLYFILPLVFGVGAVAVFERNRLARARANRQSVGASAVRQ